MLHLHTLGHGAPDLLVANARLGAWLIECKDGARPPSERKLTDDQLEFHRTWPLPIFIVASVAEVAEVVQKLGAKV